MKHGPSPGTGGDAVGSAAVTALGRIRQGRALLLELGIAQAAFAVVLALAGTFLETRGWSATFILGAAGAVLLVSGLLLVLWTDPDTDVKP